MKSYCLWPGRSEFRGSILSWGWEFLSSPQRPDRLWGPPLQWVPGAVSPGVKRPGRESDHSPPPVQRSRRRGAISPPQYVFIAWCLVKHRENSTLGSAEVENAWNYTSTPPYVYMASWLIRHREDLFRWIISKTKMWTDRHTISIICSFYAFRAEKEYLLEWVEPGSYFVPT
jgi:hypothetical protein